MKILPLLAKMLMPERLKLIRGCCFESKQSRIKLSLAIAYNALKKQMKLKIMQKKRPSQTRLHRRLIVLSQLARSAGKMRMRFLMRRQLCLSLLDENLKKYVDAMKSGDSSNAAVPPTSSALPSDSTPKIKDTSAKKKQ